MPTLPTYRDTIRKLSPPWLQNGLAEGILYAIAVQIDAFGDAVAAGVKQRFPGLYSMESLPLIGRERRILRGRTEDDATYAARLPRWRIDHRRRGGPYALLAQIYAHYAPSNFAIQLVYASGRRFSMDTSGVVTRDDIGWLPDAFTSLWARWWLFFQTDAFGAPTGDALDDIKAIPRAWNAAHCLGYVVLLPAGAELIDYPDDGPIDQAGTIDTTVAATTIAVDED